jgi:hypothetical protein
LGQNLPQKRAEACNEKNFDAFYDLLSKNLMELG